LHTFLYAGHNTISSTLRYCYFLLSSNPAALSKVREEHKKISGIRCSPHNTKAVISSDLTLLNQIPFTTAVIKEVLRMFPPAGSSCNGSSNLVLTDERRQRYPTNGCRIWILSLAIYGSPGVFECPDEFIPDRWL
ncbi:cytochrome P450, partial [Corynespora cassiicola Philippines]